MFKLDKDRLKLEMVRKNISITDMCKRSGISMHTLYSALKGNQVHTRTAALLCEVLDLDPSEVILER